MNYDPQTMKLWLRADLAHGRQMSVQQKLDATMSLFYIGCEMMRSGIRAQFPEASHDEIERILSERIAKSKRSRVA